ncbi:MAG: hypothetical protein O3C63_06080 [Cyanobacteria bacterium]|nr:hypothetical protein [Cyanobacteriota bacterium]MDA1020799.1 hypothetical protein [Cyanobacteriota bacterium]
MFRKALICLISLIPLTAQADVDQEKYVNLYRIEFDKKTAADLYASPAENKNALEYRKEIVDFLSQRKHKIPNLLVKKRWRQHLSEYPSLEHYEEKLDNSYVSHELVRKKFLQNQYMDDYFKLTVKQKAIEDLDDRNKIQSLAEKNGILVKQQQIDEKLLQFIENQGGKLQFDAFLAEHQFSKEDVQFFIETDLIKDALITKMLQDDIKQASDNHFKNVNDNSKRQPRYYFSQAFIPHSVENAKSKIEKAQDLFQKESSIFPTDKIDPEIRVMSLDVPVALDTRLFVKEIKDELVELSNNGSMISSQVSKVIKSANGYHLLQINGVEVRESLSYDKAKLEILQKLKEQRAKDIDGLYSFFIPEDQG